MLKLNQKGALDPIVIILLVVVLAMGGYIGYAVLNKDKEEAPAETTQTAQQESQAEQQEPTEEDSIPEGFVAYSNQEIGAEFAYPGDFGEVELKFYDGVEGKRFTITFTNSDKDTPLLFGATADHVAGGVSNIGYKGVNATDNEVASQASDYTTKEYSNNNTSGKYYYYDSQSRPQSGDGYKSEHVYVFDLNGEYAGIAVFSSGVDENLSDELKAQLEKIASTVKPL